MGESEKIKLVKAMLPDMQVDDETISAYLTMASSAIADRMYPFRKDEGECERVLSHKYDALQCRLAVRYISRMGGEGETAHNENGINRSYGSANDEDLLCEVMQVIE